MIQRQSVKLGIDLEAIDGFYKAFQESPKILLRNLAKGYQNIGRSDNEKIRASIPNNLNIRAAGLVKTFKYKATNTSQATSFEKLFADEFTKWRGAAIFETGGTIHGKSKNLTVLLELARRDSGRRRYSMKQLRDMIASGKAHFIKTPHGVYIVRTVGKIKKNGEATANYRTEFLAKLVHSVNEKKRIDFYGIAEKQQSIHQEMLEDAVDSALAEIAAAKLK